MQRKEAAAATAAQTAATKDSTAATTQQTLTVGSFIDSLGNLNEVVTGGAADTEAAFEAVVQAAQKLADSSGEVVTTIYGKFIPGADLAASATSTLASTASAAANGLATIPAAATAIAGATVNLGSALTTVADTAASVAASNVAAVAAVNSFTQAFTAPAPSGPFTSGSIGGGGTTSDQLVAWLTGSPQAGSQFSPVGLGSGTSGGNGVNLTVNVTGNSITSQALVDQLVNQVGNAIINKLRVNGGLKL